MNSQISFGLWKQKKKKKKVHLTKLSWVKNWIFNAQTDFERKQCILNALKGILNALRISLEKKKFKMLNLKIKKPLNVNRETGGTQSEVVSQ